MWCNDIFDEIDRLEEGRKIGSVAAGVNHGWTGIIFAFCRGRERNTSIIGAK